MFKFLYNPLEEGMTKNQFIGWVLYLLLVVVSVWATGESLKSTFVNIPRPICYIIGAMICAIIAAMLSIIKDALAEKVRLKAFFAFVVFLFVWGISLVTNTHNFYLKGSLDNIRKNELYEAKKQLILISQNSDAVVNQAKDNYQLKINNLIASLKGEIQDEGKPGLGPNAEKILIEIEREMNANFPRFKAVNQTMASVRDLANRQGKLIHDVLQDQLESIDAQGDKVKQCTIDNNDGNIIPELEDCIENYPLKKIENIKTTLSNAYNIFNTIHDCITQLLDFQLLKHNKGNLMTEKFPDVVESIELEHISSAYGYVNKHQGFNTSRFLFAFALALGVDLGSFVIFYFMAIAKTEDPF